MEDEDLDISLAIDNETIYNSVIEDIDENGVIWYFRNQFDGGSSSTKYSKKAMYNVLLDVRGNKIGQLSNKGAIVSNLIQEMPYKIFKKDENGKDIIEYKSNTSVFNKTREYVEGNREIIKWKHAISEIVDKDFKREEIDKLQKTIDERTWEIFNGSVKKRNENIEKGICLEYTDIPDAEIKDFIIKNFQEYKKYSYYLLYLQMVAIDQPKTNLKVEQYMIKPLFKALGRKAKKPIYIYHAKYKQANAVVKYSDCRNSNTLLCNFAKAINQELGHTARAMDEDIYNNKPLIRLLEKVDGEINEECVSTLKLLEDKYHILRSEILELLERNTAKENREELGHYKGIRDLEKKINETKYSNNIAKTAKKNKLSNLYQQKEKLEAERIENKKELLEVEANICRLNTKITEEFNKIDLKIAEDYKKTVQAKYNDKVILRSLAEVKRPRNEHSKDLIHASCRFILNFAFAELEKELIEKKKGIGTMYKEAEDGEIKYLNTNYKVVPVELVSLDLDRKETLKKKENLGILTKIRGQLTTEVETVEGTLELREEENNVNIYVADAKIGFIYPNFKEAVLGLKTIEVKEIEMGKENKSVSIYF